MPKATRSKLPTSGGYKILLEVSDDEEFSFNPVIGGRIAYKHTFIKATAEKKAMWEKDHQLKDGFDRFENAGEDDSVFVSEPQNFVVRSSPNLGLFSLAALQVVEDGLVIHWPVINKDNNMEVEDQSEGGTERDASEEADVQIQEEEGDEEGGEISVGNTLETREGEETKVQKLQAKLYAAERKLVEERNHRKEELAEITTLHQSLVAEKEELRLKNLTNQAKIKELENQHWADRKEVEDLKKMMDRDVIAERKKNDALQAAIAEAEKFFEMGRNCLKEEKKQQ